MEATAADIARRAAGRLTADFGPGLPAFVEGRLQNPDAGPQRFTGVETAIAAAAALVSIAQFAWQVYRDLKKDRAEVSRDAIARTIRLQVELPAQVTAAGRDRMVAVVVEEMLGPPPRR